MILLERCSEKNFMILEIQLKHNYSSMNEHLSSSNVFLSGVQGIPGQPGTPGGGNGMFVASQIFLCNQTENLVEAISM